MSHRPNYRFAVSWIGLNDSPGDADALDAERVSELVTVGLVADLWGKQPLRVATDVVSFRKGSDLRTLAGTPGPLDLIDPTRLHNIFRSLTGRNPRGPNVANAIRRHLRGIGKTEADLMRDFNLGSNP